MGIDWKDLRREDRLRFVMVSPQNMDTTYGELEGVDLSGSSLSCGYYTDTRGEGSLRVVGGNWIRGSFVRVIHEVVGTNYSNVLGTYLVTSDDSTRENGVWVTELELESILHALSTDLLAGPWTRAKGSSALAAMRQILKTTGRPYVEKSPNDKTLASTVVMETGTSYLEQLYAMCEATDNRLDVDPYGKVTISPYVQPSAKTPEFTIDLADPRGIAVDGIRRSTDWLSMVDTAIVSYKYTESVKSGSETKSVEREITAYAKVSEGHHSSHGLRGYTVAEFHSLSDMTPQTHARAQQLANEYLNRNSPELIQWEVKTAYLPIWEGDVVYLVVRDGDYSGRRKCLVKSIDLDLSTMTMDLTLKETSSGDKGDSNE